MCSASKNAHSGCINSVSTFDLVMASTGKRGSGGTARGPLLFEDVLQPNAPCRVFNTQSRIKKRQMCALLWLSFIRSGGLDGLGVGKIRTQTYFILIGIKL